ncbi:uncharacterized protein CXorf38 homolog isoform X2 [Petaurus breviceps papuanus]|uniref:uncharacterized protein CXorf38 homolog isoform X2 n=1 Tax=Petaurus breviceps papuanus TaxID=3040969 RepID=UPI0036DF369B
MVLSELALRLNCTEYKNWVKAGHCLLLLRACLQGFIRAEVDAFHQRILSGAPNLGPRASCSGGVRCTPRARQPQCELCAEWKKEILKHHTNRNGDIYWGNCKPECWPFDPWELAKPHFPKGTGLNNLQSIFQAFMPRGLADKKGPEECDAVALLSLINSCDHFRIDRKKVIEVIKCRNEIMHSSEMKVSSTWLQDFQKKIQSFLNEFRNIPEIAATSARVEQLLTSDWAVHIPGDDQLDGPESETKIHLSESEINEIEMELLREKLQENYLQAEEQAISPEKIVKNVEAMKIFLRNNKDLRISFEEEIQKLEDLNLQYQKCTKEPGK